MNRWLVACLPSSFLLQSGLDFLLELLLFLLSLSYSFSAGEASSVVKSSTTAVYNSQRGGKGELSTVLKSGVCGAKREMGLTNQEGV